MIAKTRTWTKIAIGALAGAFLVWLLLTAIEITSNTKGDAVMPPQIHGDVSVGLLLVAISSAAFLATEWARTTFLRAMAEVRHDLAALRETVAVQHEQHRDHRILLAAILPRVVALERQAGVSRSMVVVGRASVGEVTVPLPRAGDGLSPNVVDAVRRLRDRMGADEDGQGATLS